MAEKYVVSKKLGQECGWDVQQTYSPRVLVGNWSEDRLGKFRRGSGTCNTTHREDYLKYSTDVYHPDVTSRTKGILMNDGLNKDRIFTHHGKKYMHNHISTYDQHYERKHCAGIRKWDRHHMAWLPEASDHPIQGHSTNFGMKEAKEKRLKEIRKFKEHGDFLSSYRLNYRHRPADTSYIKPLATPRHLSSNLHPHNIHKNLHFRGSPLTIRAEMIDPRYLKTAATI